MNDLFDWLTGRIYQFPEWSVFVLGCVTLITGVLAFIQLRRGLGFYFSKKRLLKQFRRKIPAKDGALPQTGAADTLSD